MQYDWNAVPSSCPSKIRFHARPGTRSKGISLEGSPNSLPMSKAKFLTCHMPRCCDQPHSAGGGLPCRRAGSQNTCMFSKSMAYSPCIPLGALACLPAPCIKRALLTLRCMLNNLDPRNANTCQDPKHPNSPGRAERLRSIQR